MCMSSETNRSSTATTSSKPQPHPHPHSVLPNNSTSNSTTVGNGSSSSSNDNNNRMLSPPQAQSPLLFTGGLSPRSVIGSSGSNVTTTTTGSSSNSHDTSRRRSDTELLLDDRDDHPSSSCCGWKQGLIRLRRGRQHVTESRTMAAAPTTTTISTKHTESPSSLSYLVLYTIAAVVVAMTMIWFSLILPFVLAPSAAIQTYVWAQYMYHTTRSSFDNTIWTYGTDYFLALCMMTLIHMIPSSVSSSSTSGSRSDNHKSTSTSPSSFDTTAFYTRGLLASYMISVLAGGLAHQMFTTVALQNTTAFRFLWTICVGAVAMASAFMGAAASSLLQYDMTSKTNRNIEATSSSSSKWSLYHFVPILPVSFWFVYAFGITSFVMIGGFSFQRPACDIFVVGITQFPSTFYMMMVLYSFGGDYNTTTKATTTTTTMDNNVMITLSNRTKYIACCGFILNAPLLPLYPILVQYTNWSLGMINTLLHTWLLIAWTCQGMSLRQIGLQLISLQEQHERKQPPTQPSSLLQPTHS